jgi:hypothetical protein
MVVGGRRRSRIGCGGVDDIEKREAKNGNGRMLTKTVDYLDAFSRFKKKENVEAVERLLSAHKEFHKFERAQLGISPRPWPLSFSSSNLAGC